LIFLLGAFSYVLSLATFDMLAGQGEDLRSLPLSMRKAGLAQLLSREVDGDYR
jgi:ATP-dependent DNA ligase